MHLCSIFTRPKYLDRRAYWLSPILTMVQINPLGRNWGEIVNWDDLGGQSSTLGCLWSDTADTE